MQYFLKYIILNWAGVRATQCEVDTKLDRLVSLYFSQQHSIYFYHPYTRRLERSLQ